MTTYQYRCGEHGDQDVRLPMGTATPTSPCPSCGAPMARVYGAPTLRRGSRAAAAAIERSAASAERPDVVAAPPPRVRPPRPAPANPLRARLPRP